MLSIEEQVRKLKLYEKTVVTVGTFDGVHKGHQKVIKRLNQLAQKVSAVSCVVTFDPHPRLVVPSGNKESLSLIQTLEEKIDTLKAYGVNHVIVVPFSKTFSEMPAHKYVSDFLVNYFNPSIIVIGYDHRFGKNRIGNINLLEQLKFQYNYDVIEISKQETLDITISSTKIRAAISKGKIEQANTWLGHPFSMYGQVVKGRQIGRKIGFPTANIIVKDPYKIYPKNGVYAVTIKKDAQIYQGMLNIGYRPTINQKHIHLSIEIHIFNFGQLLYGNTLRVFFHKKMRNEIKFDTIEDLKKQLQKDKLNALNFFKSPSNI